MSTPTSLEEMVLELSDRYGHWSIEHLVMFYGKCKSRTFANKFQYISTKGINPEYFFKWTKKFEKQRISTNQSLLEEGRELNMMSPQFSKAMVNELGKDGKLFTQCPIRKSKLETLKKEHKNQEENKSLKLKWIEAYVNEKLKFDQIHFQKTEEELFEIAKGELRIQYEKLNNYYETLFIELPFSKKELEESQDVFISEKDEEGRVVKTSNPPLTLQIYLDRLIKLDITKLNEKNKESVEKILSSGLYLLVEEKQITTANELYQLLFNQLFSKNYDLKKLCLIIITNQIKKYNEAYFRYKNNEINESRFPIKKSIFVNYQARARVCRYCSF